MSPVRSFSVLPPSHRATFHSAYPPSGHAAANSILLSGDIMALVTKEMDMTTAMKARAVCKSWRRFVKEADLEPLETGASEQEKALGREGQQHLEEALAMENQVWTPQHTAKMTQHLTQQQEVLVPPFFHPEFPFPSIHSLARKAPSIRSLARAFDQARFLICLHPSMSSFHVTRKDGDRSRRRCAAPW